MLEHKPYPVSKLFKLISLGNRVSYLQYYFILFIIYILLVNMFAMIQICLEFITHQTIIQIMDMS